MYLCIVENNNNRKMNKQELKKELINQIFELKMQAKMDEELFYMCSGAGYNPDAINQILDNTNEIRKRIAALENLLNELEKK